MRALLSHIVLAKPVFLWLLIALPLLWLRLRGRSFAVAVWRTIVVLLLILILTDPQSVKEQSKLGERVFAFDLSKSIPAGMRRWMESRMQSGFSSAPGDRSFVFAGEAREAENWPQWLSGKASNGPIRPEKTSLEKLFAALLSLPAAPRNFFLFTDGWETEGSVERLLPAIAHSGFKVFPLLPSERPAIANVAVKKLLAPTQANTGQGVSLKVALENQGERNVEGTLTLVRDGRPFRTETLKLEPGSHIFDYSTTVGDKPLTSFRATFAPRQSGLDLHSADNQALAWVAVETKDKILVLNGRNGGGRYLEELLKRRGFEVESWTAGAASPPAPAGYGVVVFNNVEREKFSASYLAAIERHVAAGNGFLMLGGEGSFGPGGYRGTPIETISPVEFKEPKPEEKNRAVVLVIDKSGSMREDNKLLYAQEAAKAVARQLKDHDLFGVVGFDVGPFSVVPLSPVGRLRRTVDGQIDRLKAGGKTYLYPALIEAKRELERQSADKKHLIILSDGETGGSGGDYIDVARVMKEELKITISAVAIGSEANVPLMKRIAQYGGGLFHHTYDPATLPRIVLQQIQEKPDEPLVETDFTPVAARGSALLAEFPARSYPTLKGYIETELKRRANLDLMIPKGERRPPLLASWGYGRGKAAAFMTDLEGRWSKNWISWDGLPKFWEKVTDWLRPRKEAPPPHEVRVNLYGNHPVLDLYLYDEGRGDGQLRYAFSGKGGGGEGALRKLAPGHYQTTLPLSRPGDYRIEISAAGGGAGPNFPPVGYTLPYDPHSEIPRPDFNIPLLERLAQATGGEINPRNTEVLEKREVIITLQPLRPPLIILALALFLGEIIARRFLLGDLS